MVDILSEEAVLPVVPTLADHIMLPSPQVGVLLATRVDFSLHQVTLSRLNPLYSHITVRRPCPHRG